MQRFVDLYRALDESQSSLDKIAALAAYLGREPPEDCAWVVSLLIGRRLKRLVPAPRLRDWCTELTELPAWLFAECQAATGDLAETIALLLGARRSSTEVRAVLEARITIESQLELFTRAAPRWHRLGIGRFMNDVIVPMSQSSLGQKKELTLKLWVQLGPSEMFILNKILTGSFRVGVSRGLVEKALAQASGLSTAAIAQRLTGHYQPSAAAYTRLISPLTEEQDRTQPYPFYLASPLTGELVSELGAREDWCVEWKWDGIRAQILRRSQTLIWSRGEELITHQFPECIEGLKNLPDGCVLDGEIIALDQESPDRFQVLQERLGQKAPSRSLQQRIPVVFVAFDLLEWGGVDRRACTLRERRQELAALHAAYGGSFRISNELDAPTWTEVASWRARARGVEGLMIKHWESPYENGRKRGYWWKWKVDPLTIDAVLVSAQVGHGRRSGLFTDYTFGLWNQPAGDPLRQLVAVTRAYSGLTDPQILQLDRWIRKHTRERFGPVRAVEPVHVFELAFEAVTLSKRHQSGLALRFPRILRWRTDKIASQANHLGELRELTREPHLPASEPIFRPSI